MILTPVRTAVSPAAVRVGQGYILANFIFISHLPPALTVRKKKKKILIRAHCICLFAIYIENFTLIIDFCVCVCVVTERPINWRNFHAKNQLDVTRVSHNITSKSHFSIFGNISVCFFIIPVMFSNKFSRQRKLSSILYCSIWWKILLKTQIDRASNIKCRFELEIEHYHHQHHCTRAQQTF